jgi:hypothetical protein
MNGEKLRRQLASSPIQYGGVLGMLDMHRRVVDHFAVFRHQRLGADQKYSGLEWVRFAHISYPALHRALLGEICSDGRD